MKQPRHRLNPFKVLVLLLYGDYSWLRRGPDGTVSFRNSDMCRILRVSSSRFREYLTWLHTGRYISEFSMTPMGRSTLRLRAPQIGDLTPSRAHSEVA
jgi:hypothetical protein